MEKVKVANKIGLKQTRVSWNHWKGITLFVFEDKEVDKEVKVKFEGQGHKK